ncbi:RNA polymerase sigma factor [Cellulomonas biazotea]|uniref:DNA-directed RNA polymerase sigma-70 factor n=1 Tax=Cellulomonas biazotea TaxID=1709 RepID=A0A402DS59_9CELL|nr:RNA polymerase sigma factor [Cellulomonas biazotea]GCE76957.1 hypothetical protein CBZ_20130 [Cellulomonas biazotea]
MSTNDAPDLPVPDRPPVTGPAAAVAPGRDAGAADAPERDAGTTDARTAQPDTVRFAALWDRYAARVQAYALRHVDPDTAQEVVSETFLVAWRRLVDVPGEPLPWLLVVARNTVANHRRSHHRARLLAHEVARLELVVPRAVDAPDRVVAERDALLRALARLTAREREAVLLVAWDGLDPSQAAEVARCSPTAFKVRLHRARRRLDAALAADDEPTAPPARTPPTPPTTAATAAPARG